MLKKDFNTLNDDVLLKLIKKGNELAFAQLFERYWESLLDNALKVLNDKELAEDVVQEVLTDFWKKSHSIDVKNIAGYLHQSAKFKAIDQIRKRKVTLENLDYVAAFVGKNSTEELQNQKDLTDLLDTCVNEMPTQCQRVFRMSRYDDLSNKEIAERLDISVRTVENHIAHALKLLRPKLYLVP